MKKRTKKLISAILSAGLIASTIGATISSASAANVRMTQNKFTNIKNQEYAYFPVYGSAYTATYDALYNNTVKAVNYFQNLGFNYYNEAVFCNGTSFYHQKVSTVYVSRTNDNGSSSSNTGVYGAVQNMTGNANAAYGMITIGPVDSSYMNDLGSARDVVAHEYIHLVEKQLAGWDTKVKYKSVEAGALMEAYSDILGEISSSDNPDWKIGTELFKNNNGTKCYRNIADPANTKHPDSATSYSTQKYYSDYNVMKSANLSINDPQMYSASTVVSHAAYLMTTTGMKKDWVAELWLNSLTKFRDPSNPTFIDCRNAVIAAANEYADKHNYSYTNRQEMMKRIKWSFDKVNIK